jgi:hypothetical protein
MEQTFYDQYTFPVRLTILQIDYCDFYVVSITVGLILIKYYTGGPYSSAAPVIQCL